MPVSFGLGTELPSGARPVDGDAVAKELDDLLHRDLQHLFDDERAEHERRRARDAAAEAHASEPPRAAPRGHVGSLFFGLCIGVALSAMSAMRDGA